MTAGVIGNFPLAVGAFPDPPTLLTEGLHPLSTRDLYRYTCPMENYRILPEASVYFVTYSVVQWLPVLVSGDAMGIVADSLKHCHHAKGLRINGYVFMPTHIHAIVFHESHSSEALRRTLAAFRQFTGRALADFCAERMPPLFSRIFEEAAGEDRLRRFWQPSRHPVSIESERFWEQKLEYMHANPCRKGLVLYPEDWQFSSARFYAQGSDPHVAVPITQLDWH
ncbi:MAG: hypothetical protein GC168_20255 [Candidatus Hydrogenedens sp.]|nr:hypothetical protein [Candidatus Hydrogenedens sp.]